MPAVNPQGYEATTAYLGSLWFIPTSVWDAPITVYRFSPNWLGVGDHNPEAECTILCRSTTDGFLKT